MAKLLPSLFKEKNIINFSASPEQAKVTVSESIESKDLSKLNLLEDLSGESLSISPEFGDNLATVTKNEFELLGTEIHFKTKLENGKTVRRSFILKENKVFAKELFDAVNKNDSNKVKYLCYKYLLEVYSKGKGENLKSKSKKISKSNSLMWDFVEDYENRTITQTQEEIPETKTEEEPKTTQEQEKAETEKTRDYEYMGTKASKEVADEVKKRYDKALENAIEDDNTEMTIPGEVQGMDEEELALAFKDMDGARGVENLLRQKSPNIDSNKAAKIFSEIFYAKWASNHFTFEDVYDTLKENKILNYNEDFEDFAIAVKKKPQLKTLRQDFDFVVELGEKIKDLRLNTAKIEKAKETREEREYSTEDQIFIADLYKALNFSDTENSVFENFIGWLNGAENAKSITMATMDGTVYLDEGYFRRHATPESALNNILNTKGLYTIDKNGSKKLDKNAITNKLNEFIKIGFVAKKMTDQSPDRLTQNEALQESANNRIVDLSLGLTDDQKKYLQLGYLLDISEKIQGEEKEAKDALSEVEKENPEFIKQLEEELKTKNVPPKIIEEIKNKMLLAVGTTIKFKDGKFEGFEEFGAGGSIDLGEGFTLSLGLAGKDLKSLPTLGLGLSLNLYKDGNTMVNLSLGTSSKGALGTMLQAETGGEDLSVGGNFGIGIDFKTGKLILGGGAEIGFKLEGAMNENIAEAKEQSPYAKAFELFKTNDDPEQQYKLLKTIPGLWATVSEIQTQYELSNLDMVNIISMIEEEITARAVRDTSVWEAPLGIISKVGVQFVGPIPIPYIGFYLGSATVFAPNRSEISKLNATRSARRIAEDKEITAEFDNAQVKEVVVFDKTVKEVTYTIDGKLAVITKEETINFAEVSDELEAYNKALEEVEMKIEQNENGKYELKVFNTNGKDLEIFIDPVLKDLALIKDGNRLCLEGNIKDMVITRERLMLPFKEDENSSNIREVVTIRSKKSLEGGRDRNWILGQTKGQYLEKRSGEGFRAMEIGTNREGMWGQQNLIDEKGYLENKNATSRTIEFADKRTTLQKGLSEEEKMARDSSGERAKQVLGEKMEDGEQIRENLLDLIREKMKDEKFAKKVAENIDNTDGLLNLIKSETFDPVLSNKELSEALSMIQDEYFTSRLSKYDYENLDEKGRDRANKRLAERMRKATENLFRGEIEKDFKTTLLNMDKSEEEATKLSKKYTETVLNDTIYTLIKRLQFEKGFDLLKQDQVTQIMAGSVFYSVTRDEKGRIVSTSTLNKSGRQIDYILSSGILKATEKKYPATSEIGKVILETLSPIETLTEGDTPKYEEILSSPMALKLLSFSPAMQDYLGTRSYNMVLAFVEHPEKLSELESPSMEARKNALTKFINLLNEIRKAEVEGKSFTFETDTGILYTIDVKTDIIAGSFSKCLNSSFLLTEEITIKGVRKENGKLVSRYSEQHDQVTSSMGKATMSVGAGVGIVSEEGNKEGGKDASKSYKKPEVRTDKSGNPGQISGSQSQVSDTSVIATGGTGGTDQFKPENL
ncbi:MAG: hypothetical protein RBS56_03180 [Candidatus Gracilibacteria bacterium]|nr:hypothetical protein [Candidatus Gracilibacteria bacterium]